MEDKRLIKRKQFFQTLSDKRDAPEKFMVKLRKKNRQKKFHEKRQMLLHSQSNTNSIEEDNFILRKKLDQVCPELNDKNLELEQKVFIFMDNLAKLNEDEDHYILFLRWFRIEVIHFSEEIASLVANNSEYLANVRNSLLIHIYSKHIARSLLCRGSKR